MGVFSTGSSSEKAFSAQKLNFFTSKPYHLYSAVYKMYINSVWTKTVFFASRLGGTSDSNFKPRNTQCIPAVKIFVFLDLNEKS